MLENNNKLLNCYCINLQSNLCSLIKENNLRWNLINNMNFFIKNNCMNMPLMNNNGQKIINIIFNIKQKEKYTLPVFSSCKLKDIFQYICLKLKYTINLERIKFTYNTRDITDLFLSNCDVSSLNISSDSPVIDVTF